MMRCSVAIGLLLHVVGGGPQVKDSALNVVGLFCFKTEGKKEEEQVGCIGR